MIGSQSPIPAGVVHRALARAIDLAVMLAAYAMIGSMCFMVLWLGAELWLRDTGLWDDEFGYFLWLLIILFHIAAIALVAIPYFLEATPVRSTGQTLGKRCLRISIVTDNVTKARVPTNARLVLRWFVLHLLLQYAPLVVYVLAEGLLEPDRSLLILCLGLAPAGIIAGSMLASKSRRGVHDVISGTIVVHVDSLPDGHPARGDWEALPAVLWRRFRRWRRGSCGDNEQDKAEMDR